MTRGFSNAIFLGPYFCPNILSFTANPGRFGPIPVRSGRFGPISGVSCFGPTGAGRFGLVSKVGHFGPI